MSQRIDMAGRVFGNWKVIEIDLSKDRGHGAYWICQCSCGNIRSVLGENIRLGRSASCGCTYNHGLMEKEPRLYRIWKNMRYRCQKPKHHAFSSYGGRGISVCNEWKSFPAFVKWSKANGYADNLTIDRIDVDGNYEPSNCQWLTKSENSKKAIADRRKKDAVQIISQ